ncbi:methyltransferase domain-containing protein [Pseudomonas sp. LS44]|uniref:methyltransferase domain-containing protein n=1 Tax=Pseudomonas sp. LS44 TaxID=1357074 RepID=UPI00215AB006|nr:methyltransferase domain-containing protein [Pseudomonas sp. LS44]UVE17946.1 methyltransferase domain-containing protein [Pseudomonas sp. LS44]
MLSRMRHLFGQGKAQPIVTSSDHPPANPETAPVAADFTFEDATLSGWFRHDSGELLEGFPIHPDDHVIDVGCGDGVFINFCASLGAEVTFADIDAEKIAAVTERLQNSKARAVHPLVSDANPLPLAAGYADKVIAMEVMEHVDAPADFLRELVRIGKPGALYLLSVPDAVSEGVQQQLAPSAHFQKPNHINIFARDEFEKLVTDAGLIIERRAYYGFYWSVWWAFFWTCNQDLSPPWHPLLENWARTWEALLTTRDGPRIKQALDQVMPKSQAIIARKPQAAG